MPRKKKTKSETGTKTYTDDAIIDALAKARGVVAVAAEALECAPSTIHRRIKDSAAVKEAQQDNRRVTADRLENKALDIALGPVSNESVRVLIWLLKTHPEMRARGYVERVESTGADGGPIAVRVQYPDDDA